MTQTGRTPTSVQICSHHVARGQMQGQVGPCCLCVEHSMQCEQAAGRTSRLDDSEPPARAHTAQWWPPSWELHGVLHCDARDTVALSCCTNDTACSLDVGVLRLRKPSSMHSNVSSDCKIFGLTMTRCNGRQKRIIAQVGDNVFGLAAHRVIGHSHQAKSRLAMPTS